MSNFALVDSASQEVLSLFSWANEVKKEDVPIEEGQKILELNDDLFIQCVDKTNKGVVLTVLDEAATSYETLFSESTAWIEKQNAIRECLDYLASTDFYYIRALDSGKPVPDDVKTKRDQIRARMVELGL